MKSHRYSLTLPVLRDKTVMCNKYPKKKKKAKEKQRNRGKKDEKHAHSNSARVLFSSP